jgi:4-diphosphocytidyl-2-C-methyl-D-erythritol kinase
MTGIHPAPGQGPNEAARPGSVIRLRAPAKINFFLHVVGRRPDGYHLLQSAFELIDWSDDILLEHLPEPLIQRAGDLLCDPADDLAVRAGCLLQATPEWAQRGRPGARITIHKQIPAGAGLGGGSSDAASTLMGLNRLWGLGLSQERLAVLGLTLGADVPFFLSGLGAAFVEGVGETLTPYPSLPRWLVVAVPAVVVPTGVIFTAPDLTRNSKPLKIADFAQAALSPSWEFGRNDLEAVTRQKFQEVAQLITWLRDAALGEAVAPGAVRMSGSGGSVFCSAPSPEQAQAILNRMLSIQQSPEGRIIAHLRICKTLIRHPEQL